MVIGLLGLTDTINPIIYLTNYYFALSIKRAFLVEGSDDADKAVFSYVLFVLSLHSFLESSRNGLGRDVWHIAAPPLLAKGPHMKTRIATDGDGQTLPTKVPATLLRMIIQNLNMYEGAAADISRVYLKQFMAPSAHAGDYWIDLTEEQGKALQGMLAWQAKPDKRHLSSQEREVWADFMAELTFLVVDD